VLFTSAGQLLLTPSQLSAMSHDAAEANGTRPCYFASGDRCC
jgi:hypothetical protein